MLSQLPEAFDAMGRSIRAGQSLLQALRTVVKSIRAPLALEFSYCYEQQNLGLPAELAYAELGWRTSLLELKIFGLAASVQQQTGGNLAEMLDNLAAVVRQRLRMHLRIQTLTAEGRLQANILVALPLVVFCILFFFRREYAMTLLNYPGLLLAILATQVVGMLWIRRLMRIEP